MKKHIVVGLAVTAVMGLGGCGEAELELISKQVETELGTQLDTMVTAYVNLDEKAAGEASVDFSAVDVMSIGTYPAVVTYQEQTAVFDVVVKDTVAPAVSVAENVTVTAGSPLYAEEVLTGITELSKEVTLSFAAVETAAGEEETVDNTESEAEPAETGGTGEDIQAVKEYFMLDEVNCRNAFVVYPEVGEYDTVITASDISGNSVEVPVHVVVGEAPAIDGVKDLAVKLGETVDFLEGVTAADCNGNDLTGKLVCDTLAVDMEKAGEYGITYTVTDENGFTAERKALVAVTEKVRSTGTDQKTDASATTGKGETQNNTSASNGTAGNNGSTGGNSNGTSSGNTGGNSNGTSSGNTGGSSDGTFSGNTGGNSNGTSSGNTGGNSNATSSGNSGGNSGNTGGSSETPSGGTSNGGTGGTNETPSGGGSNNTAGNENTGGNTETPGSGSDGALSEENQQRQDQLENNGFVEFDPSTNPPSNDLGLGEVTWN